jgi:2-polyprenyl-3-methyl-5-hydroxy-6-metoxy-1,4-benzoquinol methylase
MKSTTLSVSRQAVAQEWAVRLFNKSVLKQRKFQEIAALLGQTGQLHCLDVGSDNGVISYLLRQRGGSWKSADLDEGSVAAIVDLVETGVYQIDGRRTPFAENEFDRVIIVDFLEHIPDDSGFVQDLFRIIKPGGELVINVPHHKNSLLRKFRYAIGQTDEKHGHLRPGYTVRSLQRLLGDRFSLQTHSTYSNFFSEAIDTLIVFGLSVLKRGKGDASKKGMLVTGKDLNQFSASFKLYSLIYPFVWLFSKLDHLLFFSSGYMLIAKARVNKEIAEKVDQSNFPETADIETSSDDYARRFSGAVGEWFLQVQKNATLEMLTTYPNATILDVGGGHGQIAGGLVENNYKVTVLGSAEICKVRLRHFLEQGRCDFRVGNVLDLPYPDRSFDVVISYRLLPHVTRWEEFLAELARVARQAVILDYPEVRSVNYIAPQLFKFKKQLEGNTRHYSCFRESEILEVFKRHGFERGARFAEFTLPMVLHRKLNAPKFSAAMEYALRRFGFTQRFGSPVILKVSRK